MTTGVTMRVLDLFCCAGGAGMGYSRAGFEVVGVDIEPRDNYPFAFLQADALEVLRGDLSGYDFIHASPPCQAKCTLTLGTNKNLSRDHVDLYPEVRDLMYMSGLPGAIENPSSRPDVVLCGEMFGLGVIRHRKFELVNWSTGKPKHIKHRGRVRGWNHGVFHDGPYVAGYGVGGDKGTVPELQKAMDIHWTSVRKELTEAIPPAYTEWVGGAYLDWSADVLR